MSYLLIFSLYFLVCMVYVKNISSIFIFAIQTIIIGLLYYILKSKHKNYIGAFIELLALTIPISFRNVFGGSFGENPLCWFYILGGFFTIFTTSIYIKKKSLSFDKFSLLIIYQIIFGIIPFLVTRNKGEGLKEYLTYLFFGLIILTANMNKETLSSLSVNRIKKAYLIGCIFSCIGIFYQYIMIEYFGVEVFRISYYGGGRRLLMFLFFDMSSMTVYISTGVMMLICDIKGKFNLKKIIMIIFMIFSMAITSSRAGVITLLIVTLFYSFTFKSLIKRIIILLGVILIGGLAINIILNSRTLGSSGILNDTGRVDGYILGIKYFLNNPLLGNGYDLANTMKLNGEVIPHFAFLNMLAQIGIINTILYFIIIFKILVLAKYKNLHNIVWAIIVALIGSTIVPGFFNSRFFTVIAAITLLSKYEKKGE